MRIHKEKFAELVREYKIPMYRLAYGILRNQQDAEDVVGEAVIRAFEHLDTLKDADKFKPWIMQITANEAKRVYGKQKKIILLEDVNTSGLGNADYHDELWEIVLTLEEKYRSVIILYYYEQFKIKEIGNILHISEGTVKSRMSRAKDRLKEILA